MRQAGGVGHIPVMQNEVTIINVRVLVQMINPVRIEHRGPALKPMNLIPLLQQKLCQIRPILPCNTGNQCLLFHMNAYGLFSVYL